ncbi:MAG: leucyl/phenylalanyl-tRNA--protein transferase [Bacteroidota bacterium]
MPVYRLTKKFNGFPDPSEAVEDGLLAVGGDLTPEYLVNAYASGIFPWYNEHDPILWWSPDPRFVLLPEKFKVSKSLRTLVHSGKYEIVVDKNFETVIRKCATVKRPDEAGTWINENMIKAYCKLFDLGFAHSFETYCEGKLVGGLYCVALRHAIFGESMFHTKRDASKFALYYLVEFAKRNNIHFIDSQLKTDHLVRLGAEEIPRSDYLDLLEKALEK